jgi:hypothetical protein
MKRIALFSLVLALGLIFVQPLHADTIAYTLQANFSRPAESEGDPLGIGSGTGSVIFNFMLAPPAVYTNSDGNLNVADYAGINPTLTLIGTNADGTYIPMAIPWDLVWGIYNSKSTYSTNDVIWMVTYANISDVQLK